MEQYRLVIEGTPEKVSTVIAVGEWLGCLIICGDEGIDMLL